MAIFKKDPDRLSRFIWQPGEIVIIKPGDEKPLKGDTKPDKPAPDDQAPDAASALVPKDATDDPEQTDKP